MKDRGQFRHCLDRVVYSSAHAPNIGETEGYKRKAVGRVNQK